MTDSEDFVQINNQLPYRPIHSVKIIQITLESNSRIAIQCKCEIQGDLNEEDLIWLIQSILNNNKTYLVPKITYQSYFNLIYEKLAINQQGLRTEYEKKLKEKIIERALRLISTVILNHLKDQQEIYMHSIFIFFHKNFGLYKNPIYYKEENTSLGKKMGNFLWQKYALLSGSKNIGWDQIENKKALLSSQLAKFNQIHIKLTEYTGNLYKLQEEYIRQKQMIRAKLNSIEKLLLSYENEIKYVELVIEQIKQTLARIENKALVQALMKEYNMFLQGEVQRCIKSGKELMKYYIKVLCQNEEMIKLEAY